MRQPEVYTAYQVRKWDCDTEAFSDGPWIPARPIGHNLYSWLWRWKIASKVLFGIYDALSWKPQFVVCQRGLSVETHQQVELTNNPTRLVEWRE